MQHGVVRGGIARVRDDELARFELEAKARIAGLEAEALAARTQVAFGGSLGHLEALEAQIEREKAYAQTCRDELAEISEKLRTIDHEVSVHEADLKLHEDTLSQLSRTSVLEERNTINDFVTGIICSTENLVL